MYFHPHRPQDASQHDTSVVAAHRGHGLGAVMKAAMMRWVVEERPGVERVTTGTAAANAHMLRVNRSLGYRDLRAFAWMESGVAALAERLGSGGNDAAGASENTESSGSSDTSGESTAG